MSLTPKQLKERQKRIGASDVAAIFGESSWATPYDVWLEKTGQIDFEMREKTMDAKSHIRFGNMLEPMLLDRAEAILGPLERNIIAFAPPEFHLAATLDGQVISSANPVEAKTTGIEGPVFHRDEWGDEDSGEIPMMYWLQVHAQMLCTGATLAHVPALIGGVAFRMYEIVADEDCLEAIRIICRAFWENYVEKRVPPPGLPSIGHLKARKRVAGKIVSVPDEVVVDWLAAKSASSEADKAKKTAQLVLLTHLKDADAGETENLGTVTYYEQKRKRYTCEKCGHEPEPTVSRIPRHKRHHCSIKI